MDRRLWNLVLFSWSWSYSLSLVFYRAVLHNAYSVVQICLAYCIMHIRLYRSVLCISKCKCYCIWEVAISSVRLNPGKIDSAAKSHAFKLIRGLLNVVLLTDNHDSRVVKLKVFLGLERAIPYVVTVYLVLWF